MFPSLLSEIKLSHNKFKEPSIASNQRESLGVVIWLEKFQTQYINFGLQTSQKQKKIMKCKALRFKNINFGWGETS